MKYNTIMSKYNTIQWMQCAMEILCLNTLNTMCRNVMQCVMANTIPQYY